MNDQPGLTTTQVLKRFGGEITYRQLDYWVRQGYVTPSISNAGGYGSVRRWSEDDVTLVARLAYAARIVKKVKDGTIWNMAIEGDCPEVTTV